jgi:hypothetical protein
MEGHLFFILFYLKAYPLHDVLAFSFEMSQGEANALVHQLSAILKATLNKGGFVPPQLSDEMVERSAQENAQDLGKDGTERRIIRPANPEVQEFFYSGKARCHTVKNVIVAGLEDYQIKGLSGTCEGKKHDKKIADEEAMQLPEGRDLYRDGAFQGQDLAGANIHQPDFVGAFAHGGWTKTDLIASNTCFVPTLSALGVDIFTDPYQTVTKPSDTPFKSFYVENGNTNSAHATLSNESISWIKNILNVP